MEHVLDLRYEQNVRIPINGAGAGSVEVESDDMGGAVITFQKSNDSLGPGVDIDPALAISAPGYYEFTGFYLASFLVINVSTLASLAKFARLRIELKLAQEVTVTGAPGGEATLDTLGI